MLTRSTRRDRTSQTDAEDLVLTTITHHADALLRTARRHSICADDAGDAYQRGLEIFLRNAARVDPERAVPWLHTVIKHEALAVRKARQRTVGPEEFDGDALEALHTSGPDERLLAFEDVTRAAEALQGLKPQEVRALWLRMEGRSYKEIAQDLGWTYTKVNRCVTEGRRAFLSRYAGIESGEECRRLEPALSAFVDGELGAEQIALLRRHLRGCGGCRATLRAMRSGDGSLAAVLPVALVVGGQDGGESVLGMAVRVYEAVAHGLQERAVTLGAKAQLAVEATGAAKVAAVAGAAAAVAGGGAATVERVAAEERPEPVRQARASAPAGSAAAAAVRAPTPVPVPATSTAARAAAPVVVRRSDPPAPERHRQAPVRRQAEFAFEQARAEPAPTASPSRQQRPTPSPRQEQQRPPRPTRTGGEFDLEP